MGSTEDFWPEQEPLVTEATFAPVNITVHTEYRTDPVRWANDKLGIPAPTLRWSLMDRRYRDHRWDGTPDPIAAALDALAAGSDVGVESGTGTGKSYGIGAVAVLWWLACWENALAFTFAPKEDQLKLFIWKNIGELWPRFQQHFPSAVLTDLTIRMRGGLDESWAAHGYAVGIKAGETVSTKASGMHAADMLMVYEEMPGINPQVVAAGEHASVAPHNLRLGLGNPNSQLDPLHRFATSPGVTHVRASSLDHPNVVLNDHTRIPGAVSLKSIEKRLTAYGEDDPIYLSRVRGFSPAQSANSLFRLEWLTQSAERFAQRMADATIPTLVTGKGVDVANSEHGDSAAICDFSGNCLTRLDAFPCPDANKLGTQVVGEAKRQGLESRRVAVDAIGVGAGTVNEARRLGFIVQALYAGGKPMKMIEKAEDGRTVEWSPDVNQFDNLRSQMLWQLREDFRTDAIDCPKDEKWWEELLAHTFEEDGKTRVLPKDDIRALLGRSPDKSDCSVMANWVRARAVTPVVPEVPEGVSLGYDYAKQKPRERETADDIMQRALGVRRDPTQGRFNIPTRRFGR